ncbi:MAG: radical SAM protein [bacterium]|nr:radical SAM protein [bacterium]
MNSHETLIGDPHQVSHSELELRAQKISAVQLLLTYRCTAECSHCFTSSSTRKDDPMKLAEVQEYLKEAKKVGARRVWFFGGEPFLYFDLLLGAIESTKHLGLEATTTSNAFWATSVESALKRLRPLRERALDSIAFSADPFHWEYVPLEYVRNAVKAAKKLGIKCDIWSCYFAEKDDKRVLRLSREITTRLLLHDVGTVTFIGTAAEVLAEHAPKQLWTDYLECKMDMIVIDPFGYVQPCMGISIGNAKERKLSEIIRTYDIEHHPIMKVLNEEGPVGLAKLAMKYGFRPTEYADGCHLCYEARKGLLKQYPQYLAPAIWYERAK